MVFRAIILPTFRVWVIPILTTSVKASKQVHPLIGFHYPPNSSMYGGTLGGQYTWISMVFITSSRYNSISESGMSPPSPGL